MRGGFRTAVESQTEPSRPTGSPAGQAGRGPISSHPATLGRVRRCCHQHPSLRTARHHFDACSSSIEQRPCEIQPGAAPPAHDASYGTRLPHWPWGQPGRYYGRAGYRNRRGPHQRGSLRSRRQICFAPRTVGCRFTAVNTRGKSARFRRSDVPTPIRPITGRRSLPPSSFTRSPIGSPYGGPTLAGGLRVYHVASRKLAYVRSCLDAGGSSSVTKKMEHPDLATYRLVQASQHLWLVFSYDASGSSPGLTLPRPPGPRPPWCWQSRRRLATPSPSRGMRLRCPEGFAPPRYQGRTPR